MSTGFTGAAWTRIRTCPVPGCGYGDVGYLKYVRASETANDYRFHVLSFVAVHRHAIHWDARCVTLYEEVGT